MAPSEPKTAAAAGRPATSAGAGRAAGAMRWKAPLKAFRMACEGRLTPVINWPAAVKISC
jgi:hypothetical protein